MNRSATFLVLFSLCGLLPVHGSGSDAAALHRRYASAATEAQRVQVAMDAINLKLICRGCKIEVVDEIFSTDFRLKDPNSLGFDDKYSEVVYFDPPKDLEQRNSGADGALSYKGWYLGIKFDKNGGLVNYYLTNIHK